MPAQRFKNLGRPIIIWEDITIEDTDLMKKLAYWISTPENRSNWGEG